MRWRISRKFLPSGTTQAKTPSARITYIPAWESPSRRETGRGIAEHGAVIDAEGFDPALLAEREADEKTEFNQLRNGEMSMQLLPQLVIGDVRVPGDGAGVSERDFFPLGEFLRVGEIEQLVVFFFRESLPSSLDGTLHASIFAVDRLRDVDAAELFKGVVDDALAKGQLPGLGEGADDVGDVGAHGLAFRPRRAFKTG